jgi:hypothetical protein
MIALLQELGTVPFGGAALVFLVAVLSWALLLFFNSGVRQVTPSLVGTWVGILFCSAETRLCLASARYCVQGVRTFCSCPCRP